MSQDFSKAPDLRGLADVVRALQAVARSVGVDFFLMGADARDLLVHYAHGIHTSRATQDVDFAVMVGDWTDYERLRTGLIESRQFSSRPGPATHRFRHASGMPIDIVPFGGVEDLNRKLVWPPDNETVLDCFGMREALSACVSVQLPDGVEVKVAPIAALTILKATAWQDRKHSHPGRDAGDLMLFLRCYMDCGNLERAADEHGDLFEAHDFDHVEAGVRLLARDVARLLSRPGIYRLLEALLPEADERGALLLAHQSGYELEAARRLLEVFCDELAERM